MTKILRPRNILLMIALLIVMAVSYGFAAGNTFTTVQPVGDGTTLVSGYAITIDSWSIYGDTDPSDTEGVVMTFDAAPNNVYISFDGTTYESAASCDADGIITTVTCTFATPQNTTLLVDIWVAAD